MSDIGNLIKELRNKTGAGFLDCKKALSENQNNIEESIEYLRKKGLAKASKKSSREANEGAIGVYQNKELFVVLKINTETDFAAKSDTFLNFLDNLGSICLKINDISLSLEKFLSSKYEDGSVSDYLTSMIAQIGENLIIKELIIIDNKENKLNFYVHNNYRKNIGKLISLIKYETNKNDDAVFKLSKNICMHVAAMKPDSLDIDDLDKNIIEKERDLQKELIQSSGKPENIINKILDGKMKKFFSEVTLLNQSYILEPDLSVKEHINKNYSDYSFIIKSFKLINLM